MKKLSVSWDGIPDSTGYLFSFAKALVCAVKQSPYGELAEDIVAASGFAFRMWLQEELCPSATSIWAFHQQKPWVESGGLTCGYVERLWEQDDVEADRRLQAIEAVIDSIDRGIPAVAWDIGVPEWGLITGYDEERQKLSTLSITGVQGEMDYTALGKGEIPILSVLTITGKSDKPKASILADTLTLARGHLNGEEWCENAQGLAVYPALIRFFEMDELRFSLCWEMEYALGTYAALKQYAWRYFEKYGLDELAALYKKTYQCWLTAFDRKKTSDLNDPVARAEISDLLRIAEDCEKRALRLMENGTL